MNRLAATRMATPAMRSSLASTRTAMAMPRPTLMLRQRQLNMQLRNRMTPAGNPDLIPPAPRRRRFLPRVFLWSSLSLTLFYGVSTLLALNSDRYQDFFVDSVPAGSTIVEQLERSGNAERFKVPALETLISYGYRAGELAVGAANGAVDVAGKAYSSVAGKAGDVPAKLDEGARDARAQLKETRNKAKDFAYRVERKAEHAADDVKQGTSDALVTLREKADEVVDKTREAAAKAQEKLRGAGQEVQSGAAKVEDEARGLFGRAQAKGKQALDAVTPNVQPYGAALPLQHEAPAGYVAPRTDRTLQPPDDKVTRLRDDPGAPKLPKLAPAMSSLSGSEPMVSQLASTIDDLASFLRDTPNAGMQARSVLVGAKSDLQSLAARLESIKASEAARVEKGLEEAAAKFERKLAAAREEAGKKVGDVDAAWQKRQAEEDKTRRKEFEAQLRTELATQSDIINERLKEEVVAQGIEMQRRWMRDIKQRVEQEREGRLAKLDELQKDLKNLEDVTVQNSEQLEQGSSVHALWAAVRAASAAALADEERADGQARTRSFKEDIKALRSSARAKDDPLIGAALDSLERNAAVETGLESFASLQRWWFDRVAPACQRAALVPDHAGIGSHILSAVVAPLLYTKKGHVDGDDTPAVLARAEYWLDRRDLDSAAREINSLTGWPKILAEDWLGAARARLEAQQAFDLISAQTSFASLQVA